MHLAHHPASPGSEGAAAHDERAALVSWTARLGAVTADALARREGTSLASARGRLLAATRRGQLARTRPLAAQAALFTATRAGLHACGLGGYAPARVGAATATHAIACARAAVGLERAYPAHVVLGEPDVRVLEQGRTPGNADAALAQALRALPLPRRPDLLLARAGRPASAIAVEVELTPKGSSRLERICRAWARSHAVAGVLYLAAPAVQRPLLRAIDAADAHRRVVVLPLDSLHSGCTDPIPSAA